MGGTALRRGQFVKSLFLMLTSTSTNNRPPNYLVLLIW
jgi:hypothetical protein